MDSSEARLAGLRMAATMNIEQIIIRGDSKIVIGHVTRSFEAKEENIKWYYAIAKSLVAQLKATWLERIDR